MFAAVTFKPKAVQECVHASQNEIAPIGQLMGTKDVNMRCPICRHAHLGPKDAWHEKVRRDRATNPKHKISMQNATGVFLFSGAMRNQEHFNSFFDGRQVEPLSGKDFVDTKWQSVDTTLVFGAVTTDEGDCCFCF